jgi:hypothetical protein
MFQVLLVLLVQEALQVFQELLPHKVLQVQLVKLVLLVLAE